MLIFQSPAGLAGMTASMVVESTTENDVTAVSPTVTE
jgi:hypothetical protein